MRVSENKKSNRTSSSYRHAMKVVAGAVKARMEPSLRSWNVCCNYIRFKNYNVLITCHLNTFTTLIHRFRAFIIFYAKLCSLFIPLFPQRRKHHSSQLVIESLTPAFHSTSPHHGVFGEAFQNSGTNLCLMDSSQRKHGAKAFDALSSGVACHHPVSN